jgi:hypothetical protein
MKAEYDFSKGRRGAAVPTKGKTRIAIYIDDQIVAAFKAESARTGIGYQTLINEALARHLGAAEKPITAEQVRTNVLTVRFGRRYVRDPRLLVTRRDEHGISPIA